MTDKEQFKKAVGKYPTGVTVISTRFEDAFYGFTANSFASVSLDPLMISFCLEKKAASLPAFKGADNFAISILAAEQSDISNHFAAHKKDKFEGQNYQIGKLSGCPLIAGALSYIECEKLQEIDAGDHVMFLGKVITTEIASDAKPLVYYSRKYYSIK